MKKYNVCLPKKYKSGEEEKTFWANVGTMTEFDNGNKILELNLFKETYQIFPMKDNKDADEIAKEYTKTPKLELDNTPTEEVKVNSEPIPF